MDHFVAKDGVLHCEGVSLEEIATAVGTPVYVYSTATLTRHYQVFKDALAPRDVFVAYAVKANSNIAVLATLAKLGAGMDTVSAGEIERCRAMTDKPFGVNMTVFPTINAPDYKAYAQVIIDTGVKAVETAGTPAVQGRVARRCAADFLG